MELFEDPGFPHGAGVCGLDEAGRGPLAGPVVAACVVLPDDFPLDLLDDSKKLTLRKREEARLAILELSSGFGYGIASPHEIDSVNILAASMLAMRRAYFHMAERFPGVLARLEIAIVDGNKLPDLPVRAAAVVKADAKYPCVMAASILAKTARDRMMEVWDAIYPEYGYAGHKGYPTKAHSAACVRHGPSPIQRHTFGYPGRPTE